MVLDEPTSKDEVFKINGFKMVVDADLMQQTGGIIVDYVDYGMGSGFKLTSETPVAGGRGCSPSCSC
jgi:iron-sulfur cluster assembly protein